MSLPVIRVENLSKQYIIGVSDQRQRTIREAIVDALSGPFRQLRQGRKDVSEEEILWALKDINFEIHAGDIVGLIGHNGAGKSTLLKLLARITEPTTGRIEIRGRVASLLEVGTGFHPELTGRENVLLNGVILGMSRREILRKFDEMVEFAEIERFIDTPVKRYSSGMYLRLAFAVAAHLEPEILIIDEVLAVGDASFQKKCLAKIQDVAQEGRTVLFVSHSMESVTRLCPRAILLSQGRILADGPALELVSAYLQANVGITPEVEWKDPRTAPGNDVTRLRAVRIRDDRGATSDTLDIRRPVALEMEYDVLESGHVLAPNFHVFDEEGKHVFITLDLDPEWRRKPRPAGHYVSTAWIPGNFLAEGRLTVGAAVSTLDPIVTHFYERDVVGFQVVDSLEGDSSRGDYPLAIPGAVRPLLQWETSYTSNGRYSPLPSPEPVAP